MMNKTTFARTVLRMTKDGKTKTYQAGDVLRRGCADKEYASDDAFSDCIILGFSQVTKYGDVFVKLARPYAYASGIGTTCPSVLTGMENFEMTASKLEFETVVSSSPMVQGSCEPIKRGYDDEAIHVVHTWTGWSEAGERETRSMLKKQAHCL